MDAPTVHEIQGSLEWKWNRSLVDVRNAEALTVADKYLDERDVIAHLCCFV